jgi:hypothetical protein
VHVVVAQRRANQPAQTSRRGLVSRRWRRRLACGLDRTLSPTPGDALLSAAVAVDYGEELCEPAHAALFALVEREAPRR